MSYSEKKAAVNFFWRLQLIYITIQVLCYL